MRGDEPIRLTKMISARSVKKFCNSHGFRFGADLPNALEDAVTALICVAMRNARSLDKYNNRRQTVWARDLPPVDAIEIAPTRRERRLMKKVERLEAKLREYEKSSYKDIIDS